MLDNCDAVYIISKPTDHYSQIKKALEFGKHVLVESPVATKKEEVETRFENQSDNKRYFYQLDGEGIRYELVAFVKEIEAPRSYSYISSEVSASLGSVIEGFYSGDDMVTI